jgi:hypothetical protein
VLHFDVDFDGVFGGDGGEWGNFLIYSLFFQAARNNHAKSKCQV